MSKLWTSNEEQILWETKSISTGLTDCVKKASKQLPQRTPVAIFHKLYKLGIFKPTKLGIPKRKLRKLKQTDRAYIAGLTDGEGHMAIYPRYRQLQRHTFYIPRVSIANTSLMLLETMKEKVGGGRIYLHKTKPPKAPCYYFMVSGVSTVLAFLSQIEPYLILKKERAKVILEYCERRKGIRRHLTKEELELIRRSRASWDKDEAN